jgi:integrase
MRHRRSWVRSGRPDPALWAAARPAVLADDRAECGLPFCDLWVESEGCLFCKSHHTRWHQLGRPDTEQYVAHCLLRGKARVDFGMLGPQLKLEFQYALQCRHDQQTITAPPPVVTWALRLAANAGVGSLLDHDEQRWRERSDSKSGGWYQGFLLHAYEVVQTLHDGTGWQVEYPRDVWRLHTLPGLTMNAGHSPDARNHLRFDRITQPWLRALAKRWCRLRLSSGLCGLRASDGCTLAFDCLIHDGQGAPYLRYLNHKMRREAAVPIDEELEVEIRAQQQRVAGRWPKEHPHLFPATAGNANGQRPLTYGSYRRALSGWLAACDVRDEHGQPAKLTPHQWRHTFACRLINRDVPQEVVRVLLDHESTQMTAHYARSPTRPCAANGSKPPRSTSTVNESASTQTGRWPRPSGPRRATASPPRPCRTDTAACRCRTAAPTPTPA